MAIHINDTHPALCVPELMRLSMDEHGYGWDRAWEITCATLSYTNHTVMSEALERWSDWLFAEQLPRIYAIVLEINRRLREKLERRCAETGRELFIPPLSLCGDNAAMIAAQAYYEYLAQDGGFDMRSQLALNACATRDISESPLD